MSSVFYLFILHFWVFFIVSFFTLIHFESSFWWSLLCSYWGCGKKDAQVFLTKSHRNSSDYMCVVKFNLWWNHTIFLSNFKLGCLYTTWGVFSPSFIKSKCGFIGFTVVKVEHTDSEIVLIGSISFLFCAHKTSKTSCLFLSFFSLLSLFSHFVFEKFLSLRIPSHQ